MKQKGKLYVRNPSGELLAIVPYVIRKYPVLRSLGLVRDRLYIDGIVKFYDGLRLPYAEVCVKKNKLHGPAYIRREYVGRPPGNPWYIMEFYKHGEPDPNGSELGYAYKVCQNILETDRGGNAYLLLDHIKRRINEVLETEGIEGVLRVFAKKDKEDGDPSEDYYNVWHLARVADKVEPV